ncbi:MAG: hypothetical protein MI753_11730 [Hyphomicrobiales bacterium]|nr:hypothetical protein [Hyphomicrobiales bacterium]
METKWLTVQSFQRDQNLLDQINKLLIYYKLQSEGINSSFKDKEINDAIDLVQKFLTRLSQLVKSLEEKKGEALTGTDYRLRNLARNFVDAKGKRRKYKSLLFKASPDPVLEMMKTRDNDKALIDSLSELRMLIEDHISTDSSEIFGHI